MTVVKAKLQGDRTLNKVKNWMLERDLKIAALPTCLLINCGEPVNMLIGKLNKQALFDFVDQNFDGVVQPTHEKRPFSECTDPPERKAEAAPAKKARVTIESSGRYGTERLAGL